MDGLLGLGLGFMEIGECAPACSSAAATAAHPPAGAGEVFIMQGVSDQCKKKLAVNLFTACEVGSLRSGSGQ